MKRRTFLKYSTGAAVGATLGACGGGKDDDPPPVAAPQIKAVAGWTRTALQAIRTVKPGPPMVARSLAVLHTCMYNAWTAFDDTAAATHGQAIRLDAGARTAANKTAALCQAAYTALVDQFPSQKAAFDAYLASLGLQPAAPGASPDTAAGAALALATAELAFCHADGANQLGDLAPGGVAYADYTGYKAQNPPLATATPTPADGIPAPGHWQPLRYADASGATVTQPYVGAAWGRVKPFGMDSASQFRPGPPAAVGSPEYEAQARRLVDLLAGLTDEQKVIAEYWADGPSSELPPGHWNLIALYVSERDKHGDDEDVKLFFALSNALADAAIACWDAKRAYDSERPITAIRYLFRGQSITGYGPQGPAGGLRTIAGEAWVPYQQVTAPTPPFPEHVSGHSTFSAAAAEVLRSFTGGDAFGASYTKAAGTMVVEPGAPAQDVTLSWATFSDAADEAGLSRIFGGIHFDNANVAGKALGRKVGAAAFAKAKAFWEGRA